MIYKAVARPYIVGKLDFVNAFNSLPVQASLLNAAGCEPSYTLRLLSLLTLLRLKTRLFSRSFPWLHCCEVTLVIMDTLIVVFTYLLTYI